MSDNNTKVDWKSREVVSLWLKDNGAKLSGKLNLKALTGKDETFNLIGFPKRAGASAQSPDFIIYRSDPVSTPTGPSGPQTVTGPTGSSGSAGKKAPPTKQPVSTGPTGPNATTGPVRSAPPKAATIVPEDPNETCTDQEVPF